MTGTQVTVLEPSSRSLLSLVLRLSGEGRGQKQMYNHIRRNRMGCVTRNLLEGGKVCSQLMANLGDHCKKDSMNALSRVDVQVIPVDSGFSNGLSYLS